MGGGGGGGGGGGELGGVGEGGGCRLGGGKGGGGWGEGDLGGVGGVGGRGGGSRARRVGGSGGRARTRGSRGGGGGKEGRGEVPREGGMWEGQGGRGRGVGGRAVQGHGLWKKNLLEYLRGIGGGPRARGKGVVSGTGGESARAGHSCWCLFGSDWSRLTGSLGGGGEGRTGSGRGAGDGWESWFSGRRGEGYALVLCTGSGAGEVSHESGGGRQWRREAGMMRHVGPGGGGWGTGGSSWGGESRIRAGGGVGVVEGRPGARARATALGWRMDATGRGDGWWMWDVWLGGWDWAGCVRRGVEGP